MKVDITTDALARTLYTHGPAGLQMIAADLEHRGQSTVMLRERLDEMVTAGHACVRQVAIAGQVVPLWYAAGNGVG
jgi:hypothetical protein